MLLRAQLCRAMSAGPTRRNDLVQLGLSGLTSRLTERSSSRLVRKRSESQVQQAIRRRKSRSGSQVRQVIMKSSTASDPELLLQLGPTHIRAG